jgi:hypothetical protein
VPDIEVKNQLLVVFSHCPGPLNHLALNNRQLHDAPESFPTQQAQADSSVHQAPTAHFVGWLNIL